MNVLLDTSVVMRKVLGEPGPLTEWKHIELAYASRLLPLEVGRVIDRLRLSGDINDNEVAHLHEQTRKLLAAVDVIALSEPILTRAGNAMPTAVGSLDGIHLATALELRWHVEGELAVATHDEQQARCAFALGFDVIGV